MHLNTTPWRVVHRRSFLQSVGGLAISSRLLAVSRPVRAYVGAYGTPGVHSAAAGAGIYLFDMDPSNGRLQARKVIADSDGPSWFALHPTQKFLYAANETAKFGDAATGSVNAYSINSNSGDLTLLNTVSAGGKGPAYISVHPSGNFLFTANYAGGSVAVLRIGRDGKLGGITDLKRDTGTHGNAQPTSAPPGSYAISGHDRPHAHMVEPDPAGNFILSTDLALDRLYSWRFNADLGTLSPNEPAFVSFPSGDGPRHFQFHPKHPWLYCLQEESSTIAAFEYHPQHGTLALKQSLSSLPKGFAGTSYASELLLSKDGRFAYAGNRLHDSIACFAIGKTGQLTWLHETWTEGDYPRNFSMDPNGRFLFSCNQKGDAVTSFRVNKRSGKLTFTGQFTPVAGPAVVVLL